jgi:hypothetical protein
MIARHMKIALSPLLRHRAPLVRRALFCSLPVLAFLAQAVHLSHASRTLGSSDFDVFHMAGYAFWRGQAAEAYRGTLVSLSGDVYSGLRWTYPPPYMLLLAPFALLPEWVAYASFMSLSLVGFIAMVRSLSGPYFEMALKMSIPAISVSLAAGQNGLLFGGIIAWILSSTSSIAAWSGLGLSVLALKPQLFPVVFLYLAREQKWRAAAIGAFGLLLLAWLSTETLGDGIWWSFLSTMDETRQLLLTGNLRIFRMISVYATLYSLGMDATHALLVQSILALGIVYIVIIHSRNHSLRGQLGLVALAAPLISPYAYDYDMPVALISFSLLWPLFQEHSRPTERGLYIAGLLFASVWGLISETMLPVLSRLSETPSRLSVPTLSGFLLLFAFASAVRVVSRTRLR